MWQRMYEELGPRGLTVIAVALDARGADAARPWIQAASPTYPCLVDTHHLIAQLYGMLNVPQAVWIDEQGRVVRPAETAGTSDAFRSMDRKTGAMPQADRDTLRALRQAYMDAIHDWVDKGEDSEFSLDHAEAKTRVPPSTPERCLASTHFAMGEYLVTQGHGADGARHFDHAKRLWPDNWAFKRQAWDLDEPGKAGGPEFWAAVEALGDRHYYEPVRLRSG